jgi:heterodisulfide reductase subunit A
MGAVGVVVCPCELEGITLFDPEVLVEGLKGRKDVLPLIHHQPVCSESGVEAIRAFVERNGLDRVVMACSKPELFGPTFKKALRQWGLNPSLSEVLGIPPTAERKGSGRN